MSGPLITAVDRIMNPNKLLGRRFAWKRPFTCQESVYSGEEKKRHDKLLREIY